LLQGQGGTKAVIRRPPLGELLPKAHDMQREWSVISALGPTGFPVPEALGFCDDNTVTGALFYVMGFAEGRPLHTRDQTDEYVALDQREALAHSFVDTLADLHALDPDDIGLGGLGKKEGYIDRQVKTWYRSWQASVEPAGFDDPRAHELQAYFLANRPEQGKASVVHGDYGFHNCLIGTDARVAAVIDWEISTLGDPLADLAYTLKTWPETTADIKKLPDAATSAEGFPCRAILAERYAKRTGLDISSLGFYIGFNLWKMAAILHGVYARYMAGQKSTEGVDLKFLLAQVELSMAEAAKAIKKFDANKK
jgi:aminoglycoside phosphotransferase (APT) family kinase protein